MVDHGPIQRFDSDDSAIDIDVYNEVIRHQIHQIHYETFILSDKQKYTIISILSMIMILTSLTIQYLSL